MRHRKKTIKHLSDKEDTKKKKETHFHLPATSAQKKVFIGHWGLTGSVYAYFFYRPVSIFMRQPLCFAFFFSQIKMK
jgi:hypothetical protein